MIAHPISSFKKEIVIPGDKSITHRALMFNAVAEGRARITNPLLGEDCKSTIACMQALGAGILVEDNEITVLGARRLKDARLFVGNSGTTLRLLLGLVSGLNITCSLDGDQSIRSRPLKRVELPLSEMGAKIKSNNGSAPAEVYPAKLRGIDYTLPVLSAQVKSAILLAGLSAEGQTTVRESVKTRNHTELMLGAMGADIRWDDLSTTIKASRLNGVNVDVPSDISAAAYFLVLATALGDADVLMRGVGVNPTRTGILDVITAAGGDITLLNQRVAAGEQVADIRVRSAEIRPFTVSGSLIPRLIDEIPALCVLACFAKGVSVIRDAAELRVKESDRIGSVVSALTSLGAKIRATDDGMIIEGNGSLEGGAEVDSALDHRIAMSMYIAGLLSKRGARILNSSCVDISFPSFYSEVNK